LLRSPRRRRAVDAGDARDAHDRSSSGAACSPDAACSPGAFGAPGAAWSPDAAWRLALTAGALACGAWSFWPTFLGLLDSWRRIPDYSHGFIVPPLAVLFLWLRRNQLAGLGPSRPLVALWLFGLSLAMRHAGDAFYYTFLDAWSLLPWLAALAALVGGWPALRCSLPAIGCLAFMIPLPFALESVLSSPLQRIATLLSTDLLQFCGQPAFPEGNTIVLGELHLEVHQACSGLRLFVGIAFVAYGFVVLLARNLWEKLILLAAVGPVAVLSNAARIAATALLLQLPWFSSAPSQRLAHDVAGWLTALMAIGMFVLLLIYLSLLVKEEEVMDMAAIVRQSRL
jgi:exosortase